ncbi:MAG: hypothetical protein LCH30_10170 [Proteobacteria bacterium]|nr:hypothetical protein [Pseudomonadota bacterium]
MGLFQSKEKTGLLAAEKKEKKLKLDIYKDCDAKLEAISGGLRVFNAMYLTDITVNSSGKSILNKKQVKIANIVLVQIKEKLSTIEVVLDKLKAIPDLSTITLQDLKTFAEAARTELHDKMFPDDAPRADAQEATSSASVKR